MNTIDLSPGTHISEAARELVRLAPARATFNDIPIRARYATTQPRDIVNEYHRRSEIRYIVYQHSAKGRAQAAERARDLAAKQAIVDTQIDALGSLDFTNCKAVLAWVEATAPAADRVDVSWDRAAALAAFKAHGWGRGVNCGPDFDPLDPRNFAGWIVGQWLDGFANVVHFIVDWRTSFGQSYPEPLPPGAFDPRTLRNLPEGMLDGFVRS